MQLQNKFHFMNGVLSLILLFSLSFECFLIVETSLISCLLSFSLFGTLSYVPYPSWIEHRCGVNFQA